MFGWQNMLQSSGLMKYTKMDLFNLNMTFMKTLCIMMRVFITMSLEHTSAHTLFLWLAGVKFPQIITAKRPNIGSCETRGDQIGAKVDTSAYLGELMNVTLKPMAPRQLCEISCGNVYRIYRIKQLLFLTYIYHKQLLKMIY